MKIKLFTIPNVITLLNLLSGSMGIISLFWFGNPATGLKAAFGFVMISAVLDFFDGFTARLLKSYSPVGVQLDSLADMVSFGLLPSLAAFKCFGVMAGEDSWWALTTLAIAAFSALRLAKFNIDQTQTDEFEGLPTPANALLVCSAAYTIGQKTMTEGFTGFAVWTPWAVAGGSILLALLLISPIRMFSLKFKDFSVRNNLLRYGLLLVGATIVIVGGIQFIWLIVVVYVVVSVVRQLNPMRSDKKTEL